MNKTPRTIATLVLSTIVPTVLMSSFNVNAAPGTLQNVPFSAVSVNVQPNILFLLDDSGSMTRGVIRPDGGTAGNTNVDLTPDNAGEILRTCHVFNSLYYNPGNVYAPWIGEDEDGVDFTTQTPTAARSNPYRNDTGTVGGTDGPGINQFGVVDLVAINAGYTEIDMAGDCTSTVTRIGTLPDAATDLTVVNTKENFANWFSYYRARAYVAKAGLLNVIDSSRARVGVAGLFSADDNATANGIRIKDIDDIGDGTPEDSTRRGIAEDNKEALLDLVASSPSGLGFTPLKQSLREAGEYFRQEGVIDEDFFGRDSDEAHSTSENTLNPNTPILNAEYGGTCQANFTILFTDGAATGDPFQTQADIGNADGGNSGNGNTAWDGGNFADTISGTLADVAMRYLEQDLSPVTLSNNTNIKDIRIAGGFINHQHMSTYTIGFGVNGDVDADPLLTDDSFAWPDARNGGSASIDDMRHAAWNGRGRYLNSSEPQKLIADINNIFTDIDLRTNATTAASSVSSGFIQENSLVFQTQFEPDDWTGNLFTYRFDDDGIVDIANPIFNVQDVLNTKVLSDNSITGIDDATDNATGYTNTRNIITKKIDVADVSVNSSSTSSLKIGPAVEFAFDDLSVSQQSIFTAQRPSFSDWGGTDDNVFGRALVQYIKGDSTHEQGVNGEAAAPGIESAFRDRNKKYLGAIVNSSPQFVGLPDEFYPDQIEGSLPSELYSQFKSDQAARKPVVYVGANDGMLHAFDARVTTTTTTTTDPVTFVTTTTTTITDNGNSGNEIFAYIPGILTAKLPQLAQPAYNFDSFVDATPTIRDVFVDADGAGPGTDDAWRTYLVGGLRNGGRGIYALDVTDPITTFDSAATTNAKAAEIVRFEYTHEDLGFTYSRPQIARMNNGSWVAIVGNGYNSVGDGKGKLFIIDLETGLPLAGAGPNGDGIIDTGVGSIINNLCTDIGSDCSGLSAPTLVDLNGDYITDRIYAGDLHGNMWVFNVQDTVVGEWKVTKLFTATQTTPCTGGDCRQPITTRPVASLHPSRRSINTSPNVLVLFGTGQFIAEGDASISANQSFYSVWDTTGTSWPSLPLVVTNDNLTKDNLEARTFSGTIDNLQIDGDPAGYNPVASPASAGNFGWYIDLAGDIAPEGNPTGTKTDPFDRGRVTINPIISGSLVFFVTTVPSGGEVCRAGEIPGFLTALDFVSGKAPSFAVFLDSAGDPITSSTIPLNNGAVGLGIDTTSEGTQTRVTNIDGSITQDQVSNVQDIPPGRKAWSILR